MFDLKPYGAFIENSLRPFLKESTELIKELNRHDLYPCDIKKIIKNLLVHQITYIFIDAIKNITCTAIIGFVIWKISQS